MSLWAAPRRSRAATHATKGCQSLASPPEAPQKSSGPTFATHASKRGAPAGSWLAKMLARKPRMLVIVALANKMARIVWAVMMKGEDYRAPAAAA